MHASALGEAWNPPPPHLGKNKYDYFVKKAESPRLHHQFLASLCSGIAQYFGIVAKLRETTNIYTSKLKTLLKLFFFASPVHAADKFNLNFCSSNKASALKFHRLNFLMQTIWFLLSHFDLSTSDAIVHLLRLQFIYIRVSYPIHQRSSFSVKYFQFGWFIIVWCSNWFLFVGLVREWESRAKMSFALPYFVFTTWIIWFKCHWRRNFGVFPTPISLWHTVSVYGWVWMCELSGTTITIMLFCLFGPITSISHHHKRCSQ